MQKPKLLRHEMFFVILLKCALLYLIWDICFSQPVEEKLTPTDLVTHVFHKTGDV